MPSKCVFRTKTWRKRRRDEDKVVDRQTDRSWERYVGYSGQRDDQVKPGGLGILTHTWGKMSLGMILPFLTHGCDQRVASGDKNTTNVG